MIIFKKICWFIMGIIFTPLLTILSSVIIATSIDTALGYYPNRSTPSVILDIITIFIIPIIIGIKKSKKNASFTFGVLLSILPSILLPSFNMEYRYMIEKVKFERKVTPTIDQNSPSGVYIPKNIEDCFQELQKMLPPDFLKQFKSENENKLSKYGCSLGTWIENKWYSSDESRLKKYFNQLGIFYDKHISKIIIVSFWRYLNDRPLGLEKQIKYYQDNENK